MFATVWHLILKNSVCLFDGRDASGKGGTIRRVARYMNEKRYRNVALGKPSERQRTELHMKRYIEQFPQAGEIVLFDRSGESNWLVKHHRLLAEMLRDDPNWTLLRAFDVTRESGVFEEGLEVWEQSGVAGAPAAGLDFGGVSGRQGIDYPW